LGDVAKNLEHQVELAGLRLYLVGRLLKNNRPASAWAAQYWRLVHAQLARRWLEKQQENYYAN
jgi:hypothetical protein|tara:strand:+ start:190 stop:378 length:189 start_codon:yes stop_codon:yes gene_type:complete